MTIDWNVFSPASALAGGLLIGLGIMVLLVVNGRIAGISGIIGGLLSFEDGNILWRAAFLAGIVLVPLLGQSMAVLPPSRIDASCLTLIGGGLLVGFGSRLGSGCTSGHGVCGISRLSRRSLAATLLFMTAGFTTVFATRHLFI